MIQKPSVTAGTLLIISSLLFSSIVIVLRLQISLFLIVGVASVGARQTGHAPNFAKSARASVTVIAPPIRVATWAKGIMLIRSHAERIATSPVPPWLARQAATIPDSTG